MSVQHLTAAAAAALILLSISACSSDSGATLTAPDAHAQAQAGALTLIDIRRPDEWRQTGVAQDALQINMAPEVGGDRDAPIGLICRTGNRTTHMQQALRKAGFTQVYNIDEGMVGSRAGPGWIARGLPVEACKPC